MSWGIRGSYFESCNCDAICPCRSINGAAGGRSTHGVCVGVLTWLIAAGDADGVDLSGLPVAIAMRYSDDEAGSPWSWILYLDANASDEQRHALTGIFTGRFGGDTLRLPWVRKPSELIAVRPVAIDIDHARRRQRLRIRDLVRVSIRDAYMGSDRSPARSQDTNAAARSSSPASSALPTGNSPSTSTASAGTPPPSTTQADDDVPRASRDRSGPSALRRRRGRRRIRLERHPSLVLAARHLRRVRRAAIDAHRRIDSQRTRAGGPVLATASALGDSYCSFAWAPRLAALSDDETAARVIEGDPAADISEREQALAGWARRVVTDPNGTAPDDIARLRDRGITDREIFEATVWVAFRIAFSTVNDALGAAPDPELIAATPTVIRDVISFGRRGEAEPN